MLPVLLSPLSSPAVSEGGRARKTVCGKLLVLNYCTEKNFRMPPSSAFPAER
jgi:hypothetical protein